MVTEGELREVVRAYVRLRIRDEFAGNQSKFAEASGITRENLNAALNQKRGISWDMLALISQTIGPSMSDILAGLSKLALAAELVGVDAIMVRGSSGGRALIDAKALPGLVTVDRRLPPLQTSSAPSSEQPEPPSEEDLNHPSPRKP